MFSGSVERVLALAPDTGSAAAGQSLASARSWHGTGRSDRAVWGLCKGSGKQPYQARVDLSEPAFKCSCSSRKFPCKHGLGLMLLLAKDESLLAVAKEPGWVAEWLESHGKRAEKKAERAKAEANLAGAEAAAGTAAVATKPIDAAAYAKRAAQRESRVLDGVAGSRVWLEDLVRGDLAAAKGETGSSWDRMAARIVDAQATGLAGLIRRIPDLLASGDGWDRRKLDYLGRLHLLLRAAERLTDLPPDLATDVRTALGWTQSKDVALNGEAVADRWMTLGKIVEDDDRLRVRWTWLIRCATGRGARILDLAGGRGADGPRVRRAIAGVRLAR